MNKIMTSSEIRSKVGFDPAESAGLFVGVSQFKDFRFTEVPFAVDDAVDLASLFSPELKLIPPDKVLLALAGQPRKQSSTKNLDLLLAAGAKQVQPLMANFYDLIHKQGAATGRDGLFVAAFATHGFSDQGGDFLVAAESLHRRIELTGVKLNALFDDVSRAHARRRFVLLDACRERLSAGTRGGKIESDPAMSQDFAAAIQAAKGQIVLAATVLGGFSYDDPDRQNGVFTSGVIEGLKGGANPDDHGLITVASLATYANTWVKTWVAANRPEHEEISKGVQLSYEDTANCLPLALHAAWHNADEVLFAITGLNWVDPGENLLIDVWAHTAEQTQEVNQQACDLNLRSIAIRNKRESTPALQTSVWADSAILEAGQKSIRLTRGNRLSVNLEIANCKVEELWMLAFRHTSAPA